MSHVDEHHDERFTVVGNHLAQHPELSLTAIGLAVHIHSLRSGTLVGIKALAAKFLEGETRIASALRELETHGYLARIKERLPSGHLVTRTISYNKPQGCTGAAPPAPEPPSEPTHPPAAAAAAALTPAAVPAQVQAQAQGPAAASPVAASATPSPELHDLPAHRTARIARDVLAGLRAHDARFLLGEHDVRRLAPAVAAWLERGVAPEDVRRTLLADTPPEGVHHPAGFLTRRLTALLPPPLPVLPAAPARPEAVRRAPLQNCDGCDRAFRAPSPGRCRDCRTACLARAAA